MLGSMLEWCRMKGAIVSREGGRQRGREAGREAGRGKGDREGEGGRGNA